MTNETSNTTGELLLIAAGELQRCEIQLRDAISQVRHTLDSAERFLDQGSLVNELGTLQSSGQRVEAFSATTAAHRSMFATILAKADLGLLDSTQLSILGHYAARSEQVNACLTADANSRVGR